MNLQSISKRTSYFYKKRLEKTQNSNDFEEQLHVDKKLKIIKSPKQARIRAKQARQRKKNYIFYLQKKVQDLTKQLDKQIKKPNVLTFSNSAFSKTLIDKSEQNKTDVNNSEKIHLKGIQEEFNKLYQAVKEKNEESTSQNLNNLRQRFGVAGLDRQNWIKSLFSRAIQVLMPMHCRLLLEYCQNNEQFYKLLGGSESLKQFRKFFFDIKSKTILLESRPIMVQIKQQYQKILYKIASAEHEFLQEATKLQNLIDRIQKSMNSLFVGRILVNLDIQRRQQSLKQIFPVNFYKNCLQNINLIEKVSNQRTHFQIKQILDDCVCYQNDFLVFDELFRIN